jgi:hypothetical protein
MMVATLRTIIINQMFVTFRAMFMLPFMMMMVTTSNWSHDWQSSHCSYTGLTFSMIVTISSMTGVSSGLSLILHQW